MCSFGGILIVLSDPLPLCAVGDIGDLYALSLELVAYAVGLGKILGLLRIGASFKQRLDPGIALAGFRDYGEFA